VAIYSATPASSTHHTGRCSSTDRTRPVGACGARKTDLSAPPQPLAAARNPGGLELEARNGYLCVPGQNSTRVTMLKARTGAILISRCDRGSV
jgi:hypothetical protein